MATKKTTKKKTSKKTTSRVRQEKPEAPSIQLVQDEFGDWVLPPECDWYMLGIMPQGIRDNVNERYNNALVAEIHCHTVTPQPDGRMRHKNGMTIKVYFNEDNHRVTLFHPCSKNLDFGDAKIQDRVMAGVNSIKQNYVRAWGDIQKIEDKAYELYKKFLEMRSNVESDEELDLEDGPIRWNWRMGEFGLDKNCAVHVINTIRAEFTTGEPYQVEYTGRQRKRTRRKI